MARIEQRGTSIIEIDMRSLSHILAPIASCVCFSTARNESYVPTCAENSSRCNLIYFTYTLKRNFIFTASVSNSNISMEINIAVLEKRRSYSIDFLNNRNYNFMLYFISHNLHVYKRLCHQATKIILVYLI